MLMMVVLVAIVDVVLIEYKKRKNVLMLMMVVLVAIVDVVLIEYKKRKNGRQKERGER
jgi:cell division protein FtsL